MKCTFYFRLLQRPGLLLLRDHWNARWLEWELDNWHVMSYYCFLCHPYNYMHTQEDVAPYYEAYHCFANMLKNSKLKVCIDLSPSHCLTWWYRYYSLYHIASLSLSPIYSALYVKQLGRGVWCGERLASQNWQACSDWKIFLAQFSNYLTCSSVIVYCQEKPWRSTTGECCIPELPLNSMVESDIYR